MFHVEQIPELLVREAPSIGAALKREQAELMAAHLALLWRWNAKLNLVGPGTIESWARRHALDSLSVVRWLPMSGIVLDVGSGAGFPGLPLAIVRPDLSVVLLEPRVNRVAFLRNAVAALGLGNVEIRGERAESFCGKAVRLVVTVVANACGLGGVGHGSL